MNDDADDLLTAAAAAHLEGAPREHRLKTTDCPPMTRFAAQDLPDWSQSEAGHVASCAYCQKLLTFRFRQDCPGILELIRFRTAKSLYAPAIRAHLQEDACPRCQAVLASSWMAALAGIPVLEKMRTLAAETALGFARLALEPQFASPAQGAAFRITAGDAAGLMLATLVNERGQAVLYIEARGSGMGGRRAHVDLSGPKGRHTALVALEQIGKSATGVHRFGPAADLISEVGDEVTLFVGLEPQ